MLFDVIIKLAVAALPGQFDLLLNVQQLLVHGIYFDSPFKRVEACFQDLVLFSLLEKQFLLLHQTGVEKTDLGLFYASNQASSWV